MSDTEEWRQKKIQQRGRFTALQRLDYQVKLRRQMNCFPSSRQSKK